MSGVGGFIHECVLLDPVEALLVDAGFTTTRSYPVNLKGVLGAIDLLGVRGGVRIAIEAERRADRVESDLRKAAAIEATQLIILTPSIQVSRAVSRRVHIVLLAVKQNLRRSDDWLLRGILKIHQRGAFVSLPLASCIAHLRQLFRRQTSPD